MAVTNLAEFFRDALRSVLADQRVAVDEHTEHYVVNMLTLFARAEHLHESSHGGRGPKSLVQLCTEALEADSVAGRDLALRQLGDISLFMAGLFTRGFARSLVDVDYHIAMGGRAYDALARSHEHQRRHALAQVFAELAAKFLPLVDALGEIGDAAYVYTQRDILRLYEIWVKTGSTRARGLLRRLGIEAVPVALRAH
ncbi:MAG TPA: hypothetical protein VLV56_17725 [Burkholderiales bacterium]|nr:hypothetical protein [Burkholderiales bacterium]